MTDQQKDPDEAMPVGVNPNYAFFQIAKALVTSEEHEDAATRERAKKKASRWITVLRNILTGSVEYGSRTPLKEVPGWATLEVVTGGFATGELLANGPLQAHEKEFLRNIVGVPEGQERRALNTYFLTDAGLTELVRWLDTGCFEVAVPEEGALMAIAWLVNNGYAKEARGLLDQISAFFPKLRFYPIPLPHARQFGSRVHMQDVGETIAAVRRIGPNQRILAQKEAVEVWAPLYDRIVALFLETVEDGCPCRSYPKGWAGRALAVLGEYAEMRKTHRLCGKMERPKGHSAQLRGFLGRCARDPKEVTARDVGRIRCILNSYLEKRGAPGSPKCVEARCRQVADVSAPTFHTTAAVVIARLEEHPKDDGIDDTHCLNEDVTVAEAAKSGVAPGTAVPPSIRQKIERCLNETIDVLVERGIITSGETLARVLPQKTSELRAGGIADPALRRLYSAVYRAFRRRRSLLLLNLQKQIRIEELPWVAAIERFRSDSEANRNLARQALREATVLTLTSFPHMILPNKLVRELRALVTGAGLNIPLVDDLAADIFMGAFSANFVESTKMAAELLDGSLYATYYGIDYVQIGKIVRPGGITKTVRDEFARLCASRAGVSLGTWDPAVNGMVIEQQQILTTQNLSALFAGLGLGDALGGRIEAMVRQCFEWICKRQQMKVDKWHARLIMVKDTAYAWRQMVFFLALLPRSDVTAFLQWAEGHLAAQAGPFRNRFSPALKGLAFAANGFSVDEPAERFDARRFLGWSKTTHWLLADVQGQ